MSKSTIVIENHCSALGEGNCAGIADGILSIFFNLF